MTAVWHVGIDIGGTFTDIVGLNTASGELRMAKVRTIVRDPLSGLLDALRTLDLDWRDVSDLMHGTTMVTNALVEGRLAKVALIATTGFADVLAIGRQSRQHLYHLDRLPRPPADVPAERCFELPARVGPGGEVLIPLDPSAADAVVAAALSCGADAIAVALLHSYANAADERAVGQRLRGKIDFVSLSHEASPEAREFERTSTTVLNASVMPLAARYLDRLSASVPATTKVHLFHSAGGMASPAMVRDRPLGLALSGPAAGAAAAAAVARQAGMAEAISFDMGGTTTDVCLIVDGEVEIGSRRRLAGRPINQPMAAIESIGAGGGSIVRLERGGLFVGPTSAGADPGPACYGFGGTQPTLSDADLLLGYLDPDRPLGGTIRLDPAAARRSFEPIAAAVGQSVDDVALGIARVAHATMARAVRRVTVERGVDARGCTLIAFGGAGPMHACGLADEIGLSHIVVPAFSGGFSALGCVAARLSYAQQQTVRLASGPWSQADFLRILAELSERVVIPLVEAGHPRGELTVEAVALVRYSGQSSAVEVPVDDSSDQAVIDAAFQRIHAQLYGYATGEAWVIESLRLRASAPSRPLGRQDDEPAAPIEEMAPTRCLFPDTGPVTTPRLWRPSLAPGVSLAGPALVVDTWSTTVVAPGFVLTVDAAGNLHLDKRG